MHLLNPVYMLTAVFLTMSLTACDGDDGARGPIGPRGLGEATDLNIEITNVAVASPPVVTFRVTDQDGVPVIGADVSNLRFTMAKLDTTAVPSVWVSYVNREEDVQGCLDRVPPVADCGPGALTVPPAKAFQATRDQDGELVDKEDGSYEYTFTTDITNVTTPVAVTYDQNATHRLGIQTRGGLPTVNATYDFVPASGATTGIPRRDIVKTETCNGCHNELEAHDGREETKYCVTCHNPSSKDANSGNILDFKVMIHKLHRGEDLSTDYTIWGFRDRKHDFSDVVFPQDIRACETCHVPDDDNAPQAGNWQTNPSIAACGACHDDIDFSVDGDITAGGHPGGIVDETTDCLFCHQSGRIGRSIAESHTIRERVLAERFQYNIISVNPVTPGGPPPVVTFSITDPTNNNAFWDLTDPAFTTGGGVSRLAVLIGWDSRDHAGNPSLQVEFDNAGATSPGLPVSIDALLDPAQGGIPGGTGTAVPVPGNPGQYQVTSPVPIPAALNGTQHIGVVAIEGHPAGQVAPDKNPPNLTYALRIPVPSAIEEFPIAGDVKERRQIVSTEKCNTCHFALSMHGNNRNIADELMCVICHNPNATDANARPSLVRATRVGDPATLAADAKREESIDIKRMIHAIHAGAQSGHGVRENGLVVWGFPGFGNAFGGGCPTNECEHDFSEVRFPGILSDCETCHLEGTYELDGTWELPTQNGILASTVDTHPAVSAVSYAADLADPTVDLNFSPTAAVCSACHDSTVAQSHMTLNAGVFGVPGNPGNPPALQTPDIDSNIEACAVCHGPGRSADVAQVHEID
ncbi:MAG: OmcA/MtrC family decaheme c-type cytochrome [Gammaproteobacteria bacterium]|nr:OmcA/MtrC family decaheme c-type cytochrome [Gammaproteobacteria bacterium]